MQVKRWLCALLGGAVLGAAACAGAAERVSQEPPPELELVAESEYQWTGIAASPSGRIFVSYADGAHRPDHHVGELLNGQAYPFYAIEDQASFGSVESVTADAANTLWVLDAGKADGSAPAKLWMFDLATEKLVRAYELPAEALCPDSRLSDVRVDPARGVAYLTDMGHGGILALDLATGGARRALTDIPEVRANLQGIYFPTGLFTALGHSDGLELSQDKKTLYFSALGSDVLYAVPTDALLDESLSMEARRRLVRAVNVQNVPTDGMVLRGTRLYMGALSNEGVWEFDLDETNVADAGALLNLGLDIRWADSFALAPDGSVYFITSARNYPPDEQPPYELFRMHWPKKGQRSVFQDG